MTGRGQGEREAQARPSSSSAGALSTSISALSNRPQTALETRPRCLPSMSCSLRAPRASNGADRSWFASSDRLAPASPTGSSRHP